MILITPSASASQGSFSRGARQRVFSDFQVGIRDPRVKPLYVCLKKNGDQEVRKPILFPRSLTWASAEVGKRGHFHPSGLLNFLPGILTIKTGK